MVLLRKKRVFAAKVETTPGTAESLTGAEGVYNAYNVVIQPNIPVEERTGQGAFNRLAGVPGGLSGTATFRTDIHYDGTNIPTWASVLLPACGWVNNSSTFEPNTEAPGSNVKTVTIGCFADGKLFRIAGAMGTFQAVFPTGRMAYIDWTFTGKWVTASDTAIIAPTYPTTIPLRYATTTTTYNSVALCVESVTFDAGNTVILRECAADVTGYATALVTDRYPKITANPESTLVATRDPHGYLTAGTEAAFSLSVPVSTGSLTWTATDAQVLNTQDEDRGGVMVDALEFGCNRSGTTDDLELVIIFDPV